jgi:hypothetical protein
MDIVKRQQESIEFLEAEIINKDNLEAKLDTLDEVLATNEMDYINKLENGAEIKKRLVSLPSAIMLDSALTLMGKIGDDVSLDEAGGIRGAERKIFSILANLELTKNASLGNIIGNISDFIPISTTQGTVYQVLTQTSLVIDGKGELATDTEISTENVFTPISTLERTEIQEKTSGVLEYIFNVKVKSDDLENYKIRRGHTTVDVGEVAFFNDANVSSRAKSDSSTKEGENDKKITYTVDYDEGTVKVTLESDDALSDGEKIIFSASLDSSDLVETRTLLGIGIDENKYVPQIVNIGTKVNQVDMEEMRKNLGVGLLPQGMALTFNKISSERLGKACRFVPAIAKEGGRVDISEDNSLTKAEKYKTVISEINKLSATISKESGINGAGRTEIIGGQALFDIYNLSSHQTSGDGFTKAPLTEDNGVMFLGLLSDKHPCYYYPKYDEENPQTDDGYDNITVVGCPYDHSKRVFLSGIPIPVEPIKGISVNDNADLIVPFSGQIVDALNKEAKSRRLAKKLYIKQ